MDWGAIAKDILLALFGVGGAGKLIRDWWTSRRKDKSLDALHDHDREKHNNEQYERIIKEERSHCAEMINRLQETNEHLLEESQRNAEKYRRRAEKFEALLFEVREELSATTAELIKYRSQDQTWKKPSES